MMITVDFWQLVGLFGALLGAVLTVLGAACKLLLAQFDRRLDERFKSAAEARAAEQKHWDAKFGALENAAATEAKEWQRIERDILTMKADLPIQYVRRDDYIRNQTIIEAKIDGLAVRIENAILKGERNG